MPHGGTLGDGRPGGALAGLDAVLLTHPRPDVRLIEADAADGVLLGQVEGQGRLLHVCGGQPALGAGAVQDVLGAIARLGGRGRRRGAGAGQGCRHRFAVQVQDHHAVGGIRGRGRHRHHQAAALSRHGQAVARGPQHPSPLGVAGQGHPQFAILRPGEDVQVEAVGLARGAAPGQVAEGAGRGAIDGLAIGAQPGAHVTEAV